MSAPLNDTETTKRALPAQQAIQQVTLLGATGSIGASTLKVIDQHPERFSIFAITAHKNVEKMVALIERYHPVYAVMACEQQAERLAERVSGSPTQVLSGEAGLVQVASAEAVDTVVAAIVGAAGLLSALAAASQGKRILLANKEVLVMAGQLFTMTAQNNGAQVLPIDSEHNAIFQCLPSGLTQSGTISESPRDYGVEQVILTASGGPFLNTPLSAFDNITPEQACAHPNWQMGRKISVDSATMMNKGLELIEAKWLFNVTVDEIDIVVHPQSIIHSMVRYRDGSLLAELGHPDMCVPIAHGLGWPNRLDSTAQSLDITALSGLTFMPPDEEKFPCLKLARQAAADQGAAPIVLNAANEVAVDCFLASKIGFSQIARLVQQTLSEFQNSATPEQVSDILALDSAARAVATGIVNGPFSVQSPALFQRSEQLQF